MNRLWSPVQTTRVDGKPAEFNLPIVTTCREPSSATSSKELLPTRVTGGKNIISRRFGDRMGIVSRVVIILVCYIWNDSACTIAMVFSL